MFHKQAVSKSLSQLGVFNDVDLTLKLKTIRF